MGIGQQQARWYAIPVKPGCEELMVALIRAAAQDEGGLEECFVPTCDVMVAPGRDSGFDQQVLAPLCLVKLKGDADRLLARMKRTSALRRLAGRGAAFTPLSAEAAAWVDENTTPERRSFPMSEGCMENGAVTVTAGPLVGHEDWIGKVSHRKKRVTVRIDMFTPAIDAEMGMRIVGKR